MKEELDIEKILMRSHSRPSQRVKRAVMERFAATFGRGHRGRQRNGLWKRQVPLYAALAMAVLVASMAFLAGRATTEGEAGLRPFSAAGHQQVMPEHEEILWETARRDVM